MSEIDSDVEKICRRNGVFSKRLMEELTWLVTACKTCQGDGTRTGCAGSGPCEACGGTGKSCDVHCRAIQGAHQQAAQRERTS